MAQRNMFRNAQKGITAKNFDEQGNEVAFDIREDEEMDVKLQETVELLLAAGYFRARIKGLSPFDKIVGGMTWCIDASNAGVDVDILFEENASIGKKIALTEKIVAALPRLKCPLRLEPHQIQGLDFISIYPVVQWLVKKALESREEMQIQQRNRALFEFGKQGKTPTDTAKEIAAVASRATVVKVQTSYLPKRQFRAPDVSGADEETQVQCTLLEYGRRYGTSKNIPQGDAKSKDATKEVEEQQDLIAREEKRVKSIMKKMSQVDTSKISASIVEGMASSQADIMKEMAATYAEEAAALAAKTGAAAGGVAAHKRAITALEKQFDSATSKVETLQPEHDELETEFESAQAAAKKAATYAARIGKEMAKLDALEEDEANREVLQKLRTLVAQNESLKDQMSKFKATCESEMNSLEAKIEALQGDGFEAVSDERMQAIANQLAEDKAKMAKLQQLSAKRNREIARWQRQIDEYPSRAELNQYQRRFVDLYGQVSARLRETKQYYLQYNVQADSKQYFAKESALLDSIYENFEVAMKSDGGKEQLLKQMEQIFTIMAKNKGKVQEKQAETEATRDEIRAQHLGLVEKERLYHKSVKDYETECAKNETLLARLGQ